MARRRAPTLPPLEGITAAIKRKHQFIMHTHGGRAVHVAEQPDLAGTEVLGRDLERNLVWAALRDIAAVTILPAPLVPPPSSSR